jgi:hypothetical protein
MPARHWRQWRQRCTGLAAHRQTTKPRGKPADQATNAKKKPRRLNERCHARGMELPAARLRTVRHAKQAGTAH